MGGMIVEMIQALISMVNQAVRKPLYNDPREP